MDFIDTFAKRNFAFNQIPDLKGKVAIITGSNTGVSALSICAVVCGTYSH